MRGKQQNRVRIVIRKEPEGDNPEFWQLFYDDQFNDSIKGMGYKYHGEVFAISGTLVVTTNMEGENRFRFASENGGLMLMPVDEDGKMKPSRYLEGV